MYSSAIYLGQITPTHNIPEMCWMILPVLLVHITVIWISEAVAGVPLATPPLCTTVTPDTNGHIVDTLTELIPTLDIVQ